MFGLDESTLVSVYSSVQTHLATSPEIMKHISGGVSCRPAIKQNEISFQDKAIDVSADILKNAHFTIKSAFVLANKSNSKENYTDMYDVFDNTAEPEYSSVIEI